VDIVVGIPLRGVCIRLGILVVFFELIAILVVPLRLAAYDVSLVAGMFNLLCRRLSSMTVGTSAGMREAYPLVRPSPAHLPFVVELCLSLQLVAAVGGLGRFVFGLGYCTGQSA
jgi:hypothetical protein